MKQRLQDSSFVLVYSLGDEMYKWACGGSLREFSRGVGKVYSFRGKKETARQHLTEADVAPFDGRAALRAAEKELNRRQKETQKVEQQRLREQAW